MADNKCVIVRRKYRGESSVVSVRLPDTLLKQIDGIAEQTGRTRNDVVQKCLEFAVENLEIQP